MRGGREASLARFSVFALLAVMLPAAVVAVLGYVSLRQWQASAELLFREQSRAMAAMAAEKIRMVLGQREDEVVSRLRGLVERPGFRPEGLDACSRPRRSSSTSTCSTGGAASSFRPPTPSTGTRC